MGRPPKPIPDGSSTTMPGYSQKYPRRRTQHDSQTALTRFLITGLQYISESRNINKARWKTNNSQANYHCLQLRTKVFSKKFPGISTDCRPKNVVASWSDAQFTSLHPVQGKPKASRPPLLMYPLDLLSCEALPVLSKRDLITSRLELAALVSPPILLNFLTVATWPTKTWVWVFKLAR